MNLPAPSSSLRKPSEHEDNIPEPPDPWSPARTRETAPRSDLLPSRGSQRGSVPRRNPPSDNSSSDEDTTAEALRRARRDQSYVSTAAGNDSQKRVKKEAIGTFDPDYKDPRKTGLIVNQGKQVYTDVYLFCEHLRVFERYGEDSLQDYYVSMLGGGAQGWFMGELSADQRNKLLDAPIRKFCKKLTARFKRPDAEITADLHTGRYTFSLVDEDISLTQWVQRKAAYAKQLGIVEDRLIIQAIYPQIDHEISRLLNTPRSKDRLFDFIRECEDLRPIITEIARRRRGRRDDRFSAPRRDRDRDYIGDQNRDRYENRPRDRYDNRDRDDRRRNRDDRQDDRNRPFREDRRAQGSGNDDRYRDKPRDNYRDRDRRDGNAKKVTFEKKYQVAEAEPEPEPDRSPIASDADDEDEASLSDSSAFSVRSQQAY
ncbi:hypothetical protein BGZ61DRAFT_433816, partial [Ilyonectria robusta]|uniref:uncharacterized protein n=1 Tax=Ilyonectria robusta TaxID=1079257 RepID=UPI001E8E56C9